MCDFETSTEAWLERDNGQVRVWAGCIVTIEDNPKVISLVNNIDEFMNCLVKLGNCEAYFHNLKFDGEYILYWLFSHGYKYKDGAKEAGTFDCVISDMGQWYTMRITHKTYNKKYVRTTIYDSLKKIPLKVRDIAKAFKLPESKGEIDYNLYRPIGWEITDEEREYIINDCVIVAKALKMQFDKGLSKMTIGSDALNNFKTDITKRSFDYLFPCVSLEVDNDFRLAYKGGFTMVNPKFANKKLSCISFDVNSLYPATMYGNFGALPYGVPRIFKGKYKYDKDYPLYIQKIACEFKIKPNHIPTIQLKRNMLFMPTEFVTDSKEIVDLVLTSPDLELFLEHYDVSYIEYLGGYKFRGATNIFKDYIDYWADIKAKSTGGTRQLAKLMLNSLYGKFATNPKRAKKIPKYKQKEVYLEMSDPEYEKPVYTALGAFITARARAYTIRTSQAMYKHWVYSDTDSMYLTGITEEEASKFIDIHPTKLGAWKLEHHVKRGKWLRPKTYIMNSEEDGLQIACAGMPENIKNDIIELGEDEAFKAFTYGAKFTGKLTPKRVAGGVVLKATEFTIHKNK